MAKKMTIEEMQQIAANKGGKCLSDTYTSSSSKLLWECEEGHQWEAVPYSIRQGTWCPHCARNVQLSIEDMHEIAKNRGGKCLSETYVTARTKLLWECAEGHQWEALPDSVKRGTWCRKCKGLSKLTIEEMQELAKSRGGKCLSTRYINNHTDLHWECNHGHRWFARPGNIKTGTWCPLCAAIQRGVTHRLTIQNMQEIAVSRGGKCLSRAYINDSTNLLWECAEGHQWLAPFDSLRGGGWCPHCTGSLGERLCYSFFEQLFKKRFRKIKPKWLINTEGNRMELDGYCKPLKLAFEHHGEQHYRIDGYFITNESDLEARKQDDELKKKLCEKHGIALITIPEIPTLLPVHKVKAYIKRQCEEKNIPLPPDFDKIEVDLRRAYMSSFGRQVLKEMRKIAESKGGKLLSTKYETAHAKLKFECIKGHRWEASPANVGAGKWCPKCKGSVKYTVEDMQELAKSHGGRFLSKKYTNVHTKHQWECAEGHTWEATPTGIISRGNWCPVCAHEHRGAKLRSSFNTFEKIKKFARERGGKCLSQTYKNARSRLRFECAEGHLWETKAVNVRVGHWCPVCAKNAKLTIEQMREIAESRGGKCLSAKYINSETKLVWECSEKHRWEAKPGHIKNGSWCSRCARKSRKLTIEQMREAAEKWGGVSVYLTNISIHRLKCFGNVPRAIGGKHNLRVLEEGTGVESAFGFAVQKQ